MSLSITSLQLQQIPDVKLLITTVCLEIYQPPSTLEQFLEELESEGEFDDLNDAQNQYFSDDSSFLVLLDEARVVGTGAIRRLDAHTAELKRMWLLQPYRGQGWGVKIALMLLDFAQSLRYEKIRLDVFDPTKQQQAVRLYKQLGFYEIDRYNDGPCQLFMEKVL